MKYLFLFLISLNSFASYVAGSKANDCSRMNYSNSVTCEQEQNESCHKVPNDSGECGIFKLQDTFGGSEKSVEECGGQQNCESALAQKSCLENQDSFIDSEYTRIYCMDKTGKELVVDQALKSQKNQVQAASAQTEALILSGRKAREACNRVLDLIGGFNLLPGRSQESIDSMVSTFADAKAALQDGRPSVAKVLIQAIPVDGVLVTQPMKDLALLQLSEY